MDTIDLDLDFEMGLDLYSEMDPYILETLFPLGGAYDIFSQQWDLVPADTEAPARDVFTDCLRILQSMVPGGRPLPMGSPVLGPGGNSADSSTLLGVPTVGTPEVAKNAKVPKTLKCELCDHIPKTSGNLNRHIRAVHFRSKKF
jgi:hypothetical protein